MGMNKGQTNNGSFKAGHKSSEEVKVKISEALKKAHSEGKFEGVGKKISKSKLGHEVSQEARNKISVAFKGKTYEEIMGNKKAEERKMEQSKNFVGKGNPFYNREHSEESKKRMSDKKDGENHWKWINGDAYYRNKFRKIIRKRDNYICMLCGVHQERLSRALDVHHINYDKNLHLLQNGISLCSKCHNKIHREIISKTSWINFLQSLLFEKYNYQYSNDNKIILPLEIK
jgi:hypothetical protein